MTKPDKFDPPVGVPEEVGPDLRRILAPNASAMTYRGTNTYLVGHSDLAVIDPGPDDIRHFAAILGALSPGQRITHILVTHAHLDHSPLSRRLSQHCGAPVYAYGSALSGRSTVMSQLAESGLAGGGEGVDTAFDPDINVADGTVIDGRDWRITAHWTPGHFGNHMCFEMEDAVFTGDQVMGWASSLISPPDGDLTDFMSSCAKLQALGASIFHSGHGAPITDPAARLDRLIQHRRSRETAILNQLEKGPATAAGLREAIYSDIPRQLMSAANRNVLAHLIDLLVKNKVRAVGKLSAEAVFERI